MKISIPFVVLLVVLVLGTAAIAGCRRPPDEAQVRQSIAAVAKAAEAGSASDVTTPLSDDFDGNGGELDRRSLANMLRLVSLRGDHVGVTMGPVAIEHRSERIVATFTVTLSRNGKWLPDQLGIYQVESAWRRDGRKWRCYTASWKRSI
jgi:hypothetical protein